VERIIVLSGFFFHNVCPTEMISRTYIKISYEILANVLIKLILSNKRGG
jgi:hypothetical protein